MPAQASLLDSARGKNYDAINKVITDKQGDEATEEIERWASRVTSSADPKAQTSVYYDADSSTLFRLSEAQVRTPEREAECEKTLRRKIKDLSL
ncbi:MAG: hypothetical protein HYS67_03550 [Deltaproteobacteria bacterium]|nr:hypothetical protein [Deltaproteobacteria bacterium]